MSKEKTSFKLNDDVTIRWDSLNFILDVRTGCAGDIIPVNKEGSPDKVLKNDAIETGYYGKLGHLLHKIKSEDELKEAFSNTEHGDILGLLEKLNDLCESVVRDSKILSAHFKEFKLQKEEKEEN